MAAVGALRMFLVDETTIRLWWEKYELGGDEELTTFCYAARPLTFPDRNKRNSSDISK